jgi:type II secretory pathway pseudopilin PulG
LIELLVVVAILGLLMSIGVPALSRARLASKRTLCSANLHAIGQALELYVSQNNETWPFASYLISKEEDPNRRAISDVLLTQTSNVREVFRCPSDRIRTDSSDPNINGKKTFFESEKTSYEWDILGAFNGVKRGQDWATSAEWLGLGTADVPLMQDWDCFHGGKEKAGSVVVMYADFSVRTDDYRVDKDTWGTEHGKM